MKNYFDQLAIKAQSLLPQKPSDYGYITLIVILFISWIVDLFIPDPLPFVDEVVIPIIALYVTNLYNNRKQQKDNDIH